MNLTPKQIECRCGHVFAIDTRKAWCARCCRPVFYDAKEGRNDRLFRYYLYAMILVVFTFAVYMAVEWVARPLS